jgi:Raf kinase inhibitor-like YbhB/YbcL family protein
MKFASIAAGVLALASAASAADFKAESKVFEGGVVRPEQFANVFGCKGANLSPDIHWSGAPAGTKSFTVTLYDKDAPTGSGFWHWVVVDIPADVMTLAAGAGSDPAKLPKGAHMATNDAGQQLFLGACPPPGETHEYRVTVKALKVDKLPVPENASGALVGFAANMNKLGETSIVARGGD